MDQAYSIAAGPMDGAPYKELPVPVPPMLEESLHYHGRDRFIGLVYLGQDLCLIERTGSRGGASVGWAGLQAYLHHPLMVALLHRYQLFDEGASEPPHGLILDRRRRRLLVGPARGIWGFVQGPIQEPKMLELSEEEFSFLAARVEERAKSAPIQVEALKAAMHRNAIVLEELREWLRQLDSVWEKVREQARGEGAHG